VQPSRPYTGSDDTIVERTFGSMNTLFCQHLAGYAGRDTTRRGPNVAREAIWTVAQLQELFDEWVVAGFSDRFKINILNELLFYVANMSMTSVAAGRLAGAHLSARL
jgi:hypothetical protein